MLINKRVRQLYVLTAAAVMVAGCTTLDPHTGEERPARVGTGAAIGAAAGGVIGAISGGNRLKRAAIGAGIGALAGAGVGTYMDRKEERLRRELEGTDVSVVRRGDDIILNMPSHVTFDFDSAALKPEFFDVLNSIVRVANEFDQTVMVIDGHTDSVGSASYNQGLSERRADTVGRYLVSQGINPVRVGTYGYGFQYPVASNETESGRAMNRRVEVTMMPVTG